MYRKVHNNLRRPQGAVVLAHTQWGAIFHVSQDAQKNTTSNRGIFLTRSYQSSPLSLLGGDRSCVYSGLLVCI